MKINPGFNLRDVCGENVVVAEGEANIDFSQIIALNETAAHIWKTVAGKPSFTIDDMVEALTAEYEVSGETALSDCQELVASWKSTGLISE